jgi:DNA-directed RNA polymerase subunit RPC12/RpoP
MIFGKISSILPTLIVFNLLFGWIIFGFYNWLLIGILLIFLMILTTIVFGKTVYSSFIRQEPKNKDVIDVEGGALDDEQLGKDNWTAAVSCPRCFSTETRFIEPKYEMSLYECLKCGVRFEVEE